MAHKGVLCRWLGAVDCKEFDSRFAVVAAAAVALAVDDGGSTAAAGPAAALDVVFPTLRHPLQLHLDGLHVWYPGPCDCVVNANGGSVGVL